MGKRQRPADDLRIEPAGRSDVPLLLAMVRELAAYERLEHEVTATEIEVEESLFGPRPAAQAVVARLSAEPVGFALFFTSYSTFLGRRGLYLEDIFGMCA